MKQYVTVEDFVDIPASNLWKLSGSTMPKQISQGEAEKLKINVRLSIEEGEKGEKSTGNHESGQKTRGSRYRRKRSRRREYNF
jgi:hypothetical protein